MVFNLFVSLLALLLAVLTGAAGGEARRVPEMRAMALPSYVTAFGGMRALRQAGGGTTGNTAAIQSRAHALHRKVIELNVKFQQGTAEAKNGKKHAGKVQA